MAEVIDVKSNFAALPVRKIGFQDLKAALRDGLDDFKLMPTYLVLLALIYPLMGLLAGRWAMGNDIVPLLFPLISGFALVGPLAAVGLYELSRRREAGLDTRWTHVFDILKSPALVSVIILGVMLMLIFLAWLFAALALYRSLFGAMVPASLGSFLHEVMTTPQGFKLIFWGNLIGAGFAVATLAVSAISFPLVVDRNVAPGVAVATSIRALTTNPVTMFGWGAIVAGSLLLGAIPLLVGLAVVMPVLGHGTWHLYRRVVV